MSVVSRGRGPLCLTWLAPSSRCRCQPIRHLRQSAQLHRQLPKYRQRYRRTIVPPYHSTRYADEDPVTNFAPTDEYPLDGSLKSTRYNKEKELLKRMEAAGSLPAKLNLLTECEDNMWYRRLRLPMRHPCANEFAEFVTRAPVGRGREAETAGGLETAFSKMAAQDRRTVVEDVLQAVRSVDSQHRWPEKPDRSLVAKQQHRRIQAVMETLLLSGVRLGLIDRPQDFHADESATVEMFCKRHGLHASSSKRLLVINKHEMQMGRFLLQGDVAWQLRSRLPLATAPAPLFDRRPPEWPYDPELLGLPQQEDFYQFSFGPKKLHNKFGDRILRCRPGFHPGGLWQFGDPCQFVRLMVVNGDASGGPGEAEDPEIRRRLLQTNSQLLLFASTSAQAFCRGFNWLADLSLDDLPFRTRCATFVGDSVHLSSFQLNTVAPGGPSERRQQLQQRRQATLSLLNEFWCQGSPTPLWRRHDDGNAGAVAEVNEEALLALGDRLCGPSVELARSRRRALADQEEAGERQRWIGRDGETEDRVGPHPEPPEPLTARGEPNYNHLYFLDPLKASTLYKELQSHPSFPRLPEAAEARAEGWRRYEERRKMGRRKVVRKPFHECDTFQ